MAKSYSRYMIQHQDENASGARPYWNGKVKDWVPGRAFASLYKDSHRAKVSLPERGAWVMIDVGEQEFIDRLKLKVMANITKDRNWATYGLDEVDGRVRAIVADLKEGRGEIRKLTAETAVELGIPATLDGLYVFFNTPLVSDDEDQRLSA